ncbi:hypothetical protein QWZ13_15040 [Reinekea marina]|uniref:hypothetical protein n=1 Tax=Reinekea marina TaxID=1310421 RepID=UPI0025B497CF|nr:hypothetical protein [Reinekea marina]MDN3650233.1 hypothetical protein [Reinekea marina]
MPAPAKPATKANHSTRPCRSKQSHECINILTLPAARSPQPKTNHLIKAAKA